MAEQLNCWLSWHAIFLFPFPFPLPNACLWSINLLNCSQWLCFQISIGPSSTYINILLTSLTDHKEWGPWGAERIGFWHIWNCLSWKMEGYRCCNQADKEELFHRSIIWAREISEYLNYTCNLWFLFNFVIISMIKEIKNIRLVSDTSCPWCRQLAFSNFHT